MKRIRPALALACVVGAALRFATLDVQSLWYDEAITARLLRMDLSGMLRAIPSSESSPPLYYVLAWAWTHVLGTGEAGLRSLPALLGTATIVVVWALARRLAGDRGALIAAALVAINPLLVWFSQEARAYALLALLAALSTLLWLRAIEQPRAARRAGLWALVAALALATHYYALFLVAPQALWLVLHSDDRRARLAAIAPLAVALAALAPLALHQRSNDSAAFIGDSSLALRVAQLPKQLLVGYDSPAETLLAVFSMLLSLVAARGVWLLISRGPRGAGRDDAVRVAGIVAAVPALALLAALAGEDHLITRNLLAVAPIGAALAGAGLAALAEAAPSAARATVAAACLVGMTTVVGVALDPGLQRDDWRGAVRALGHAEGDRAIVATPASAFAPLQYYLPSARELTEPAVLTGEIDYIALSERSPGDRPAPPRPAQPPPVPGYALIGRDEAQTFTVLRLRAPAPQPIAATAFAIGLDGKPGALLLARR